MRVLSESGKTTRDDYYEKDCFKKLDTGVVHDRF